MPNCKSTRDPTTICYLSWYSMFHLNPLCFDFLYFAISTNTLTNPINMIQRTLSIPIFFVYHFPVMKSWKSHEKISIGMGGVSSPAWLPTRVYHGRSLDRGFARAGLPYSVNSLSFPYTSSTAGIARMGASAERSSEGVAQCASWQPSVVTACSTSSTNCRISVILEVIENAIQKVRILLNSKPLSHATLQILLELSNACLGNAQVSSHERRMPLSPWACP